MRKTNIFSKSIFQFQIWGKKLTSIFIAGTSEKCGVSRTFNQLFTHWIRRMRNAISNRHSIRNIWRIHYVRSRRILSKAKNEIHSSALRPVIAVCDGRTSKSITISKIFCTRSTDTTKWSLYMYFFKALYWPAAVQLKIIIDRIPMDLKEDQSITITKSSYTVNQMDFTHNMYFSKYVLFLIATY